MDETPKTPARQRRRRIVTVAVITVFAVVGLAELAYAATYQMGSVTYNNACGAAAMNSVFNSTAVDDTVSSKTAKVDFNNFTESARIYLPGSCAPATQVC